MNMTTKDPAALVKGEAFVYKGRVYIARDAPHGQFDTYVPVEGPDIEVSVPHGCTVSVRAD